MLTKILINISCFFLLFKRGVNKVFMDSRKNLNNFIN